MLASTHCHQCPSISPSTRGYFFGTFTSLFSDDGNNRGCLPPHPQDTLPLVPTNSVHPSKSFSLGISPKASFWFTSGSSSLRRSGVIPPSIQYRSRSLPFCCLNLNLMELLTGPLSG